VAQGTVVRFDRRRGYGFVAPDDGGEDVFVHQNNINMEGFRFLQVGERVSYELEVGEKGMKAVSVALLEPRQPRPARADGGEDFDGSRDDMDDPQGEFQQPRRAQAPRAPRAARAPRGGDDHAATIDKLRRKQERLINLLVEKGILAPGDIDGVESSAAKALENAEG
jgi:cold shock protein